MLTIVIKIHAWMAKQHQEIEKVIFQDPIFTQVFLFASSETQSQLLDFSKNGMKDSREVTKHFCCTSMYLNSLYLHS